MELAHRTRNDLATIISILRLQARSDANPAVQAAIASALARIEGGREGPRQAARHGGQQHSRSCGLPGDIVREPFRLSPWRAVDCDTGFVRRDYREELASGIDRLDCQRARDERLQVRVSGGTIRYRGKSTCRREARKW
ncbi:histidine kinase dimerization/phosphoacceptor domain -containing protein [Bradyrhizobium japonicum]|uniref:histidine kinase dimerization/phosphoacceptor domain -containing protein n=2 Tax=Nitrobacteraceae TaxID=41294 RepID=UPI0035B6942E